MSDPTPSQIAEAPRGPFPARVTVPIIAALIAEPDPHPLRASYVVNAPTMRAPLVTVISLGPDQGFEKSNAAQLEQIAVALGGHIGGELLGLASLSSLFLDTPELEIEEDASEPDHTWYLREKSTRDVIARCPTKAAAEFVARSIGGARTLADGRSVVEAHAQSTDREARAMRALRHVPGENVVAAAWRWRSRVEALIVASEEGSASDAIQDMLEIARELVGAPMSREPVAEPDRRMEGTCITCDLPVLEAQTALEKARAVTPEQIATVVKLAEASIALGAFKPEERAAIDAMAALAGSR